MILKKNKKSHLKKKMFLDEEVDIQRFDILKYPALDKITEKHLGFFWRPEEVDVSKDKKDFDNLTEHEQHIFTSNLKRQILLDSVQGRASEPCFPFLLLRYPKLRTGWRLGPFLKLFILALTPILLGMSILTLLLYLTACLM